MKKTLLIPDPILGPVNVTSVQQIIDHKLFQRLRFIKQLAVSYLFFPGATHTRFEHSIGAYKRTCDRMNAWVEIGLVSEQEARDIAIYGLVHDIGHGPFSHLIEPLCSINHDIHGLQIVNELEGVIRASGGRFKNILAMFEHRNPLYLAVHDKNLGTEKFDYLERDSHHTGWSQKPGVANLTLFVSFCEGQVVIDGKALDEAMQLQRFYLEMYKNVYMRKGTITLQRMFQKMIGGLMVSGLPEYRLWEMTDDDLMVELRRSKKKWIRYYDEKFLSRELPKVGISLKRRRFIDRDVAKDRRSLHSVFGIDGEISDLISKTYKDPEVIEKTEAKLAQLAGLPLWSVILVPIADPHRFIPQDIKVMTADGLESLRELRPDHFDAMEETAHSYATVRIATFPEYREEIANPKVADKLVEYLIYNAKKQNPPC